MCYTKKDRELEKEARRITESRLMEEEALRHLLLQESRFTAGNSPGRRIGGVEKPAA
jgi:hypothetical protein